MKFKRGTCVAYEHSPGEVAGHKAGRRVFDYVKKGTIFWRIQRVQHTNNHPQGPSGP